MTPSQYLAQYHSLSVVDPLLKINCTINIQAYVSGMPSTFRTEYTKCISKIARFLKLNYAKSVPTWFKISDDQIPPHEYFSQPALRRAYGGRASYSEIRDAVRLAVLTRRCKATEARQYAEKWFGQDCNAFVGNYQGISPSTSIAAYVAGYGDGKISGATSDVYMTVGALPLPPVTKLSEITCGTVLATYRPAKTSKKWAHIALVDSFSTLSTESARVNIVEWGRKGSTSAHTSNKTVTLKCEDFSSVVGRFKGKKIYGFWDKKGKDLRLFLNAAKWLHFSSRGWRIGNSYES